MKSIKHGKNISKPEVTNISEHGFWLYIDGQEYFLSFKDYPWFKQATIEQITHLELHFNHHLYWPELDVDLSTKILVDPRKYSLLWTT